MSDQELIFWALVQYRNKLETGDSGLSVDMAIKTGQSNLIKALNDEQKAMVIRLNQMIANIKL
jgi:hypothetical protein